MVFRTPGKFSTELKGMIILVSLHSLFCIFLFQYTDPVGVSHNGHTV